MVSHDCSHHDAGKDKHRQVRLFGHEQGACLKSVDGKSRNQHCGNAVAGDSQGHHGDKGTAQGGVVSCLRSPYTGRISFSKTLRLLAVG